MDNSKLKVADDVVVSLEYELKLDDGQVVDSADSSDPLEFLQGYGEIIPGLEEALYGLTVGDELDVIVDPEDGYGDYDPDETEVMSRDTFPADMELDEDMMLEMRDADSGEIYQAYISEVRPKEIVLDFNHPLAGETLYFHVKIAGLRPATDEELDHGHVHVHEESSHETA
jgi:FKBP-type peptidyl-prolyl cis-trans isomerase SlyD